MKLRSIQVLRAVAACAVVACHAVGFDAGAAGVDVFFVISGFIIGRVMIGRDWRGFLVDRLWRVLPIYWLWSVPWLLIALYLGKAEVDRTIASLTLWPIYSSFAGPYLRPAWSLCYEMLFYFSATVALATGKGRWLIAAFALCFAANIVSPSPLLGFVGYPLIVNFLLGLAIGKAPMVERAGLPAIGLGLVVLALAPASLFSDNTIGISGSVALERLAWWTLPSAALVYGALCLERFVTWNWPILVGDASYSIYLTHLLALLLVKGAVGMVVAVIGGIVAYWFVERPILRLRLPNRMLHIKDMRRRSDGVVAVSSQATASIRDALAPAGASSQATASIFDDQS